MQRVSFFLLCSFLLAACAPAAPPASTATPPPTSATPAVYPPYFPTYGWQFAPPESQGMDPALLSRLPQAVSDGQINLHSLLVIRHGYIVFERYFTPYNAEDLHVQYSVTKSFISALLGIASDEGKLGRLDQPVLELFRDKQIGAVDNQKRAMTIEDLLTMRSGLDWNDDRDINWAYMQPDMVAAFLSRPMAGEPGATFTYCSGCSHILSAIVARSVGKDTQDYAKEKLLDPIGIQNYTWERDRQGVSMGGWGLSLTPREMAKFGLLYLHNGEWDGQRIISADWVKRSTRLHVDRDELDYGYQWWIYPAYSAFMALGHGGQTIWVSPELDMVVVTTADIADHDPIFNLIDTLITPAVKE